MQEIVSISKEHDMEINCIPNNIEKYMAFMLGKHLVFLDSFQFMASSLERLAEPSGTLQKMHLNIHPECSKIRNQLS